MFTTAGRHGIPIPSSSSSSSTAKKHQHQQQQQDQQQTEKKSKKDKNKERDKGRGRAALALGPTPLSAPPTPSSTAFAHAHVHHLHQSHPHPHPAMAAAAAAFVHPRPATSSAATTSSASFSRATGRLLGHAYATNSALIQNQQQQHQSHRRPMTASGLPSSTASASSFPTLAAAPSPSASASPLPLSAPLRLTMPRASAISASVSACATPSPLSSGLPSPTLPPLPSHFSSQPQNGHQNGVGAGVGRSPALTHVRSPVINIGSSPLVDSHQLPHPHQHRGHVRKVSLNKDEFDFRSGVGVGVTRPTHIRKFSTSSDVDFGVAGEVELKFPTSPLSPGTASDTGSGCASSSMHEDVLLPGDRVGPGLMLQGEVLQRVFNDNDRPENACGERGTEEEPATELEVVRRLGAGSYAIVYLVREVLRRPPPGVDDGKSKSGSKANGNEIDIGIDELDLWESTAPGMDLEFDMDLDMDLDLECDTRRSKSKDRRDAVPTRKVYYGKEYAVKVLSKAGTDDDALDAQLIEASIHQSLPIHPNIVTLHRALETPSFLLLVLEFVPGEDLYYFLEQARDHYEPEHRLSSASASPSSDSEEGEDEHERGRRRANTSVLSVNSINTVATSTTMNTTRTPPTPSLLSTLNEKQLLGRRRLRLIASMFAQMCEAVAVCHDVGVYHRDIKPENFIVTDGWEQDEHALDGEERRVVVVKLTDFGLSTRESASSDMDCGSAPYMSYECRNNCAPTYAPRAADVWSLGIVLINMLYHVNPWTDTTQGVCPSFSAFLAGPEHFFLQRFAGMTSAVASFLTHRVFCVLPSDDPADTAGRRVSARELGKWARDLPRLLATEDPVGVPPALVTTKEGVPSVSVPALAFPPLRTTSPAPLRDSKEDQSSEAQDKDASMPTSPLTLSPTSPPSSTLLAQSLAAVLSQQEAAAATAGGGLDSSSPAWRHRRGLSNASVGYALSSVPQSRRPASRQQSFSTATAPGALPSASSNTHAHGMMIPGSAAGSRAATPLLRGRALGFGLASGTGAGAGTGMRSRVPSNNCETPAGMGLALGELPTVFDEGEGDVSTSVSGSSGSLGGGLELELGRREGCVEIGIENDGSAKEQERDRGQVEESRREEYARDGEVLHGEDHAPEQEHDQDGEEDPMSSMSRSTSMVRRRKRGARRGKGQIIQQQQMEIARLQQQQEELARKVQMMQDQLLQKTQMQHQQQVQLEQQMNVVSGQQQGQGQGQMPAGAAQVQVQVLSSLNPTLSSTNASVPSAGASSVPQSPTTSGDALDSLASASEALARELSRTRNARGGAPTSPLVHAHSYSHLHQIHGTNLFLGNGNANHVGNDVPSLSVSASPPTVPMRAILSTSLGTRTRGVSVSPSPSRSVSQTRSQSTTATTTQASPAAALALASAGGPTPGAMFPYSFASSASSTSARTRSQQQQNSSSSSASASAKEAPHATLSSSGNASTFVSSTGPASMSTPAPAPPTPVPAPAIAKKTSKWKLSFGKGSSNSSGSNSSAHSRTPLPQVMRPQSDIVVDIFVGRNEAQFEKQNDNTEDGGEGGIARQSVTSEASAQHGTNNAPSGLSSSTAIPLNASGNGNNEPWSRGRRPAIGGNAVAHPWNANAPALSMERWPNNERNVSPNSTRTGRSGTGNLSTLSSSSSFISQHSSASRDNNWRHSTLTTSSATSGWTRYSNSNASMRSVSTVATSASGTGSWRSGNSSTNLPSGERKPGVYHPTTPSIAASSRKSDKSSFRGGIPPPNVKIMTGVPWALDELPRQLHPNPSGDIFGMPPTARKQRVRKPKDLPTISERPYQQHSSPYVHGGNGKAPAGKSPLSQRTDAGRSSTSLPRNSNEDNGTGSAHNEDRLAENEGDQQRHADGTPRKVQKGQINALAKMLSALRRSNP